MQFVRDIYRAKAAAGRPVISFEFFPPKTPEGDRSLLEKTIPALIATRPDYCSVTYGAGGSTREKTLMIVDQIQKKHQLTAVAHLTCVNSTRAQIADLLAEIRRLGVHNVLALRGDPPPGTEFQVTPGGFWRLILQGHRIGPTGVPVRVLGILTNSVAGSALLPSRRTRVSGVMVMRYRMTFVGGGGTAVFGL